MATIVRYQPLTLQKSEVANGKAGRWVLSATRALSLEELAALRDAGGAGEKSGGEGSETEKTEDGASSSKEGTYVVASTEGGREVSVVMWPKRLTQAEAERVEAFKQAALEAGKEPLPPLAEGEEPPRDEATGELLKDETVLEIDLLAEERRVVDATARMQGGELLLEFFSDAQSLDKLEAGMEYALKIADASPPLASLSQTLVCWNHLGELDLTLVVSD